MNNNTLSLVTFEQAKRLKMAGFDWLTQNYYIDDGTLATRMSPHDFNGDDDIYGANCSTPSVALALRWIRDVKRIPCGIAPYYKTDIDVIVAVGWYYLIGEDESEDVSEGFDTYESAESTLLDKLLTLLENDRNT